MRGGIPDLLTDLGILRDAIRCQRFHGEECGCCGAEQYKDPPNSLDVLEDAIAVINSLMRERL